MKYYPVFVVYKNIFYEQDAIEWIEYLDNFLANLDSEERKANG